MNQLIENLMIIFVIILLPVAASADYIGPEEVLSLSWGSGDSQYGLKWDNLTSEHNLFSVSDEGTIALIDLGNEKLKYFKDGTLQNKTKLDKVLFEKCRESLMEKGKEVSYQMVSEYSAKTTIAFKDKTYVINGRFGEYLREKNGNFYGITRGWNMVTKFDPSGKYLGSLKIGSREFKGERDEFRGPVVAQNGDAYFVKSTPEKFSILKWTWRDAQNLYGLPDTPRYVEAHSSQNGIAIRWWFPFQNKDAITAFEILRSEKSGASPYKSVGVVQKKDITGFTFFEDKTAEKGVTYYYRMRTVSGDKYSAYSNEAIAKR